MNAEFVHRSSWPLNVQREQAAQMGRRAWQTSDEDLSARIDAAAEAMHEYWPHLTLEAILMPPHEWFDAALARQIVIHVLTTRLCVPRRVVAAVGLRSRESIMRGCRTIEERCAHPAFRRFVENVADRADQLYRSRRCHLDA
jgi:hypothetical protein